MSRMKKRGLFSIVGMIFFMVTSLQPVLAESNAELERRIEALEKIPSSGSGTLGQISDRLTLFGTIELDYSYADDGDLLSQGYQIMDPLLAGIRYESFDDGQSGNQDEHLDYRYSIGVTYTLFTNDTFASSLLGEYRKSEYELSSGSNADDNLNEFFARIAIEF